MLKKHKLNQMYARNMFQHKCIAFSLSLKKNVQEQILYVIRINIVYLQTVIIKQPGLPPQNIMQVNNVFMENFIFCPLKATT